MSDFRSDFGKPLLNITLAFLILLLQSWIGDALNNGELFKAWDGVGLRAWEAGFVNCLGLMLLLCLVLAGWLYHRRSGFLPARLLRTGEPGQVTPHAVLVLGMSRPGWDWQPAGLRCGGEFPPLPATLPEALACLADLPQKKFAWEQLLRAIEQHVPAVQRLILIGSRGQDGTAAAFETCKRMIAHYFPALDPAIIERREASFEALDELLAVYRQIIAEEARSRRGIMIDVTGGTKVVSIAAAMVTQEHPEIEFQYVETEGGKRLRSFNMVTARSGGDGG